MDRHARGGKHTRASSLANAQCCSSEQCALAVWGAHAFSKRSEVSGVVWFRRAIQRARRPVGKHGSHTMVPQRRWVLVGIDGTGEVGARPLSYVAAPATPQCGFAVPISDRSLRAARELGGLRGAGAHLDVLDHVGREELVVQ